MRVLYKCIAVFTRTVVLVALFGCWSMALASPFLVCDPQPTATYYLVSLDNGPWIRTPAPLHFDLEGIAPGPHSVSVKAANDAGESAPASLDFKKKLPENPAEISIH